MRSVLSEAEDDATQLAVIINVPVARESVRPKDVLTEASLVGERVVLSDDNVALVESADTVVVNTSVSLPLTLLLLYCGDCDGVNETESC